MQGIEKTMDTMRKPLFLKRLFKKDEHEATLKEHKEGLKTALLLFQVRITPVRHPELS